MCNSAISIQNFFSFYLHFKHFALFLILFYLLYIFFNHFATNICIIKKLEFSQEIKMNVKLDIRQIVKTRDSDLATSYPTVHSGAALKYPFIIL